MDILDIQVLQENLGEIIAQERSIQEVILKDHIALLEEDLIQKVTQKNLIALLEVIQIVIIVIRLENQADPIKKQEAVILHHQNNQEEVPQDLAEEAHQVQKKVHTIIPQENLSEKIIKEIVRQIEKVLQKEEKAHSLQVLKDPKIKNQAKNIKVYE